MNRRSIIKSIILSPFLMNVLDGNYQIKSKGNILNGRINHSVCRWTFNELSIETLCQLVNMLGFSAIDLIEPKDFKILKKFNINVSMCTGAHISLEKGLCNPIYHDQLEFRYKKYINIVADAGYKNLICFSGNKEGISNEEGLINTANGLKRILPIAEKRGVTLHLELFNSIVDHKDYMADNSAWGIKLCKLIGSKQFKLLYDIYHMQIMEGNIIDTISKNYEYFGHYHTAGVPGRHEIDQSQELNYMAIMKAIYNTGFNGYVAQEFIPRSKNKVKSLANAIYICDI